EMRSTQLGQQPGNRRMISDREATAHHSSRLGLRQQAGADERPERRATGSVFEALTFLLRQSQGERKCGPIGLVLLVHLL
ncbi:MAG: hypothetical protein AB7P02_15260, partial [Alphaproteobacteria bacterium]